MAVDVILKCEDMEIPFTHTSPSKSIQGNYIPSEVPSLNYCCHKHSFSLVHILETNPVFPQPQGDLETKNPVFFPLYQGRNID